MICIKMIVINMIPKSLFFTLVALKNTEAMLNLITHSRKKI
ncbi:hypothetical protein SAMN05444371_3462 [Epilithonimonas mollis]|uniref:Uncharacterized protein n=1 Tax=Epilithonimonas mollis TaxID=216903 RepID=A0A1M6UTL5_9FLAO|nr:hypothetical protein SAMN05444371_3462 [Epilithonimonas mollis]